MAGKTFVRKRCKKLDAGVIAAFIQVDDIAADIVNRRGQIERGSKGAFQRFRDIIYFIRGIGSRIKIFLHGF